MHQCVLVRGFGFLGFCPPSWSLGCWRLRHLFYRESLKNMKACPSILLYQRPSIVNQDMAIQCTRQRVDRATGTSQPCSISSSPNFLVKTDSPFQLLKEHVHVHSSAQSRERSRRPCRV